MNANSAAGVSDIKKLYRHTKESILERSLMNAKNVANVLAEYQEILQIGLKIT